MVAMDTNRSWTCPRQRRMQDRIFFSIKASWNPEDTSIRLRSVIAGLDCKSDWDHGLSQAVSTHLYGHQSYDNLLQRKKSPTKDIRQ
jgi:hypothetical protein